MVSKSTLLSPILVGEPPLPIEKKIVSRRA
jgi:hypothetical protein